uniref:Leishmanolysin-like peptidase n=1 Tax=Phallusia mammillata TaxID=59560 RepID=A0A6F9DKF3_9ASCI|nr:leishmanolysin-like peptidase [Phallusia mammillata]
MKICPQIIFLVFSQCIYVGHLFSCMMVTSVFHNFLLQTDLNGAMAKCIHDNLEVTKTDQSPQRYVVPLQAKSHSRTKANSQNSNANMNKLHLNYYYYHWRKTKVHETAKSISSSVETQRQTELHRKQRSLNMQCSNKILRLLKTWRHLSLLAKRDVENENQADDAYDDEFEETDGITYFEDSQFDENDIEELFKPLRITVWYDIPNIAFKNGTLYFERLQQGIEKAVKAAEKILSVIPVKDRLLLSRHNICAMHWRSGVKNTGRCAQFNPGYKGEMCLNEFVVPSEHLEGFAVYNQNTSSPIMVHYNNGTGLSNTDLVLYVRSKQTLNCLEVGTTAYAAYCQLDQFNRPVSGYANFCPQLLMSDDFDSENFYLTVLHELFHILGFSQKLFDKFQDCSLDTVQNSFSTETPKFGRVCEDRNNVVSFVKDWYRILSPAVLRESTNHFNCTGLGGPLEGTFQEKRVSSHWESRYLQPSIMTASLGLAHLTVLDRITLAVFEDSGWYQVNYSQADELLWGKNAGCEFGTRTYCRSGDSPFFCTSDDLVNGCHYLHLDKGVCKSNNFLDSCKMYVAEKGGECWKSENAKDSGDNKLNGETYNINSRCFISNLSSEQNPEPTKSREQRSVKEEGRCYEHRCNNSQTLEIRVSGADWVRCIKNRIVKIPGYAGSIRCPDPRLMCNPNVKTVTSRAGSKSCATVNISFSGLRKWLGSPVDSARLQQFVDKFENAIHNAVETNGTTIQGRPYISDNTVVFQLKTDESISASKYACGEAVRRLKAMVTTKVFKISPPEGGELFATHISVKYTLHACEISNQSSTEQTKAPPQERPPPGIIAATAVGALCVCVFASVGGVLYWKSTIPRSVGPTTVSAIEVNYQPNRSSVTTGSDSSVGQIEFPV